MAVTRDDVIAVAPELGTVGEDDGRWEAFLADADLFASSPLLTSARADAAKKYLVAHWMTASVADEAAAEAETGPLKSVTIGPVTKTFDTKAGSGVESDSLSSTSYGKRYLQLIRVAGVGVI